MSIDIQQGDVFLFQTVDGGDISITDGITQMNSGLETAVYLSLFGGNEDDDGIDGNRETWWGNVEENEKSKKQISETQHLLRALPLTANNLLRVENAAVRDLEWMIEEGAATEISAEASIPEVNKLKLVVTINTIDETLTLPFVENWKFELS